MLQHPACNVTGNGAASSVTVASARPPRSRWRIARRVGSARAAKVRGELVGLHVISTFWLNSKYTVLNGRRKEAAMGRIVVTEFISLDGVIEAARRRRGLQVRRPLDIRVRPRGRRQQVQARGALQEAEAQPLGRRTYEGFAAWMAQHRRRVRLRRDVHDAEGRRLQDVGERGLGELHDPAKPRRGGKGERAARRGHARRRQRAARPEPDRQGPRGRAAG